ncbi:MAG: hypothetical protein NTV39_04145 [Candidatus Saccharibacteria bacterium]|nr:hypothetical protein [Candidatus Saccharibacteria bacterium]
MNQEENTNINQNPEIIPANQGVEVVSKSLSLKKLVAILTPIIIVIVALFIIQILFSRNEIAQLIMLGVWAVVIPIYIIFIAWKNKYKGLKRFGIISFVLLVAAIVAAILITRQAVASADGWGALGIALLVGEMAVVGIFIILCYPPLLLLILGIDLFKELKKTDIEKSKPKKILIIITILLGILLPVFVIYSQLSFQKKVDRNDVISLKDSADTRQIYDGASKFITDKYPAMKIIDVTSDTSSAYSSSDNLVDVIAQNSGGKFNKIYFLEYVVRKENKTYSWFDESDYYRKQYEDKLFINYEKVDSKLKQLFNEINTTKPNIVIGPMQSYDCELLKIPDTDKDCVIVRLGYMTYANYRSEIGKPWDAHYSYNKDLYYKFDKSQNKYIAVELKN